MTNLNDPERPESPVYGTTAPDEAIYRDVAAETGVVPDGLDGAPQSPDSTESPGGTDGQLGAAQQNAREVADTAKEQATQVASDAKDKAADVAGTAKTEGRHLLSQARDELRAQAHEQQQRAASGLSATAEDLRSMADGSQRDGTASNLVRQASERADEIGRWLADREPGEVLDEVRAFARRRPGVFIAAAAVAGVVAGRLTRSLKDSDE